MSETKRNIKEIIDRGKRISIIRNRRKNCKVECIKKDCENCDLELQFKSDIG